MSRIVKKNNFKVKFFFKISQNKTKFRDKQLSYYITEYSRIIWSKITYHLFFDDCLNYLNFNSLSDEFCTRRNPSLQFLLNYVSI